MTSPNAPQSSLPSRPSLCVADDALFDQHDANALAIVELAQPVDVDEVDGGAQDAHLIQWSSWNTGWPDLDRHSGLVRPGRTLGLVHSSSLALG